MNINVFTIQKNIINKTANQQQQETISTANFFPCVFVNKYLFLFMHCNMEYI